MEFLLWNELWDEWKLWLGKGKLIPLFNAEIKSKHIEGQRGSHDLGEETKSELMLLNLCYKRQTQEQEQPNRQVSIGKLSKENSDSNKPQVQKDT